MRARAAGVAGGGALAAALVAILATAPRAGADAKSLPPWADPRALRLRVARAGPVALLGSDLVDAGWALTQVEAASVSLSRGGRPAALRIEREGTALEAGPLRPTDRLIFVAAEATSAYTERAVYWLQPRGRPKRFTAGGGDGAGHSVALAQRSAAAQDPAAAVTATEVIASCFLGEEDYFVSHFLPPGGDRWMWQGPLGAGRERVLELPRSPPVARDGRARLALRVVGATEDPALSPDQHVGLYVGESRVSEARFEGRTALTVTAELDAAQWARAANEGLVLRNERPRDSLAQLYVDHMRCAWDAVADWRDAEEGALRFETASAIADGAQRLIAQGLDGKRYALVLREHGGPSPARWWSLEPRAGAASADGLPAHAQAWLWPVGSAQRPVAIERNAFAGPWAEAVGEADWIAIGPAELLPPLAPLAAWRERQGLRARLVDLQDVWDEASGGSPDPAALAELLATLPSRPPERPRHVLLVGEANLDHRGGLARRRRSPGPADRMPTWTLDRADGRALTSDLPYLDRAATGMQPPGSTLGRIPGATAAEVAAVVSKILAWEGAPEGRAGRDDTAPARPSRQGHALFVDDDSDPVVGATAQALARRFGRALGIRRLDGAHWRATGEDLPATLRAELAAGPWIVTYVGHGNADTWALWPVGGRLLHAHDLQTPSLQLGGLLLAASCLNGAFDHPVIAGSLAERWLLSPGGGVAAWAPSGRARLPAQAALLDALAAGVVAELDAWASVGAAPGVRVGRSRAPRTLGMLVGDARRAALAGRPDRVEASLGMVLLGDPAMPLRPGAGAAWVAARETASRVTVLPWVSR